MVLLPASTISESLEVIYIESGWYEYGRGQTSVVIDLANNCC